MKCSSYTWAASLLALSTPAALAASDWHVGQKVATTSGDAVGHPASLRSGVSEYLGIPYADPPTGEKRWKQPTSYTNKAGVVFGAVKGSACIASKGTRVERTGNYSYVDHLTPAGINLLASNPPAADQDEDCLTLNIWTKPQVGDAAKAVLVFVHGGSFISGSGTAPLYTGEHLADLEDIVVVTINYRLNIFGFPGSPAAVQNLGLYDQRFAALWLRDNIAAFGGDPRRIVLAGQSAGSICVDLQSYAFAQDPVVAGLIPMSGLASSFRFPTEQTAAARWYNATETLGCGGEDAPAEQVLSCMRGKTPKEIVAVINSDAIPGQSPDGLWWGPVVDDVLVFADYAARPPPKTPVLLGNLDNEYSVLRAAVTYELTDDYIESLNNHNFNCPAAQRARRTAAAGTPTWRYRGMGVFPNTILSYDPPSGAWHSSELPGLFGTTPQNVVKNTPEQDSINAYMQGAWAAFAKDSAEGLSTYRDGWPRYNPNEATLVRLGHNNVTGAELAPGSMYDAACA